MKPWYVQSNFMNHGQAQKLAKGLQDAGIRIIDAPVMPCEELLEWPEEEYVVYGSTKMVSYAHKQGRSGVFYDPQKFNARAWETNLGPAMLNRPLMYLTAGDIRKRGPGWAEGYIESGVEIFYHIRPVEDLKPFDAKVLSPEEFGSIEKNLFESFDVADDVEIVMSEAVNIQQEVRFFIVGGKVITGSYYRRNRKPFLERIDDSYTGNQIEAWNKAYRIAAKWLPHENCVLDLAMVDGRWRVLEFNCINASGFYDHDVAAVASALSSQGV